MPRSDREAYVTTRFLYMKNHIEQLRECHSDSLAIAEAEFNDAVRELIEFYHAEQNRLQQSIHTANEMYSIVINSSIAIDDNRIQDAKDMLQQAEQQLQEFMERQRSIALL